MGKATVHIAAVFSMLFWGFSYIWSKIVFEFYTPLTTIFFRLIISFITLFLLMFLFGKFEKIKKEDTWLFLVSSIFNPFLYFLFESYGLSMVSATISAFIIATIPVFTPFVGYWIFKEKLSTVNIIGLIISFFGVLMIVFNFDMSYAASPLGITFLFLGVISAVVYSVFLKKLTYKYKPMTIIGWQNLLGAVYFIPFVYFFDYPEITTVIPSGKAILSLILLGVFASSFAYALFAYVVGELGISKANIYSNLIGVFAGVASYFFLQEKFTAIKLTGMLVIISGVMLSEIEKRKPFKKRIAKI
jgi:drug/metabolite transporter (DMT)-like permease